ncbi:hypothetical protein GCM10023185_07370 [Hymenobacter saemangeumensis]|uniref:MORN repeat-containing protein n=1 Tax=Hymenobacter saemangeumensis TaxID=1084522 RepID=A0ABP8I2J2_9BACT
MKHLGLLLACSLTALGLGAQAQCLKGDCQNGQGTFDFGYATYTGQFKNGKPEGQGTMDYGGGESFRGAFVNGQEHGAGTFTKNGQQTAVYYKSGQRQSTAPPVAVGGNIRVEGCQSGDCYNGRGVQLQASGARYEGQFRNGQAEGQGTVTFPSGQHFSGTFAYGHPHEGTFTYADGIKYVGTYDDAGRELNGYYVNHNGTRVETRSGRVVMPPAPKVWVQTQEKCSACEGKGSVAQVGKPHSYTIGGTYTTDGYNNRRWIQEPQTYTSKGLTTYWPCSKCGGKGSVAGQKLQELK